MLFISVVSLPIYRFCERGLKEITRKGLRPVLTLVPGHEIVGRVIKTGNHVNKFKAGDLAGVGCFVDSCRECPECKAGLEQYCDITCSSRSVLSLLI
ncbi:MAG: alcohol dehydrogenase catalytic domain-containing protein [Chthoniobacterales bacterium]